MALVNMREVRYNLELLHVTLSRVRPYDWIRPPSDIGWIVPAASAAVWLCLWLTARREGAGAPDRALVRAAATTLAVTVVFALADEVRVFSPVVWLLLVAIAIRAESSRAATRG